MYKLYKSNEFACTHTVHCSHMVHTCCREGLRDHLNRDVNLTLSFPGYGQENDGLAFNGIKEKLTKLD